MFEGKVRKRADGRYELQIVIGRDEQGRIKRKSFYGKRENEVIKKKDEWIKETYGTILEEDESVGKLGYVGFSDWALSWLSVYKKGNVREYTYEFTYKRRVTKYLIPYFGDKPISIITPIEVQKFFNEHRNLSLDLQKTLRMILKDIFAKAIDNDYLKKNPAMNIKLQSTYISEEKVVYNETEQRKAMDWLKEHRYFDLLLIFKTGLRRGELIGLRDCDFDLRNQILYVKQSVSPTVITEEGDEVIDLNVKRPKSKRAIPLDNEITACLKTMDIGRGDNYTFYTQSTPDAYASRTSKILKRMAKECDLPPITLHGIRHTFGTVLREKGVDIYSISKLLGHSSIGVTASIYVHNDIEVLRQVMLKAGA